MVYNLTGIEAANHTMDLIASLNTTTDGALIGFLLFLTWLVILIAFYNQNIKTVALVASFVTTIIGAIIYGMGWIGLNTMLIPALLTFVSILVYKFVN